MTGRKPTGDDRVVDDDHRYGRVPGWIFQAGLLAIMTHSELRLLVALCQFADPQGRAWPSRETLCKATGVGRGHFADIMQGLIAKGILKHHRFRQGGKRWAQWMYQLAMHGPYTPQIGDVKAKGLSYGPQVGDVKDPTSAVMPSPNRGGLGPQSGENGVPELGTLTSHRTDQENINLESVSRKEGGGDGDGLRHMAPELRRVIERAGAAVHAANKGEEDSQGTPGA